MNSTIINSDKLFESFYSKVAFRKESYLENDLVDATNRNISIIWRTLDLIIHTLKYEGLTN